MSDTSSGNQPPVWGQQQPHLPQQYGVPPMPVQQPEFGGAHQPYGAPQWGYRPPFRPDAVGLGWASMALAVGLGLVSLLALAVAGPAVDTYRAAAEAGDSADYVLTWFDGVVFLWLPLQIAAYVITCLWLHRCRQRVDLFVPQARQSRSPVWVWLGWVVPFVSFWFPFQVVRDLRAAGSAQQVGSALVGWWWAAWLVYVTLDAVTPQMLPLSGDIDMTVVEALVPVQAISTVACLVALTLWLMIVRQIMRDQAVLGQPWSGQPQFDPGLPVTR